MTYLRLTALGGLGETGARNCMLYESESTAILVDCGVGFPDNRFPGVEVIHCDYDLLEAKRDKLKAVVLTHGHEDHVGGLPYLLKRFPLPVYATEFTQGLVHLKLKEFGLSYIEVLDLEYNQKISIGDISIDPVFINHSIMDVAALLIAHDGVSAFHCTDFKIDKSAPEGRMTDVERFKEIGDQGLDLLLLDSTNALVPGWTESEMEIRENLLSRFKEIKGRAIACLFASNSFRVQSLIECARVTGRKVALTGRSTKEYFEICRKLDRMDTRGVEIYDVEDLTQFPDDQILLLATGSQAEPRAVLSRISKNMFKPFSIKEGDTLLMTSKMIPGNEGKILEQLNRLANLGAIIIDERMKPKIHASGHGKEDELREVMKLTKPKNFLPIHGEFRALTRHKEIAVEEGVDPAHSVVALNGDTVELTKEGLKVVDVLPTGVRFVSENYDYEITEDAIRRRNKLSWNGLVTVSVVYDHQHSEFIEPIQVFSEGLFGGVEEGRALKELREHLDRKLADKTNKNVEKVQKFVKVEVRRFYKRHYNLRPEVITMVHEI